MNTHKSTSIFTISSFLFLLVGSIILSSCESSRVGPELPAPNPPVPPAQPLVVSGYVKNSTDLTGISSAVVKVAKTDATVLSSILTDNTGKYEYDATNLTDITLNISASKDGYGFKSGVASLNKTSNSASVTDILLTKLTVASTTVTVAAGGTVSTPNTQSAANQPLTITVPANAVSQPVTLTASAVPAGQMPVQTDYMVLSAAQFGPTGTTFLTPVTITIPLPYAQTPGTTFPLMQLNEQTGVYTNSGFTATVDASGTQAKAPVTHFTTYSINQQERLNVTYGTPTYTPLLNPLPSSTLPYVSLTKGSTEAKLNATNTYHDPFEGSYGMDIVSATLKINFGTTSTTKTLNFPTLPGNYQINGVQTNPSVSGKGNWEYRWYFIKKTTSSSGVKEMFLFQWEVEAGSNFTIVQEESFQDNEITLPASYGPAKTGWYWISHDQGGTVYGPY